MKMKFISILAISLLFSHNSFAMCIRTCEELKLEILECKKSPDLNKANPKNFEFLYEIKARIIEAKLIYSEFEQKNSSLDYLHKKIKTFMLFSNKDMLCEEKLKKEKLRVPVEPFCHDTPNMKNKFYGKAYYSEGEKTLSCG